MKGNYESIENKLDEHNLYIEEISARCSELQDQIATRNKLINQQEEDIDVLKKRLEEIGEGKRIILGRFPLFSLPLTCFSHRKGFLGLKGYFIFQVKEQTWRVI